MTKTYRCTASTGGDWLCARFITPPSDVDPEQHGWALRDDGAALCPEHATPTPHGTEWAVRLANGTIVPMPTRPFAERWGGLLDTSGDRVRPDAVVVSRRVTPWTEV